MRLKTNAIIMNLRLIISILLLQISVFLCAQDNFSKSSVLNQGKWYKIKVRESGIYKLSFDDLKKIGFDNPENVRVFANSGKQLPFLVSDEMEDDLYELPLYQNVTSNYYLFFAEGPLSWDYNSASATFEQSMNYYATANYLYLTTGTGKGRRIQNINNSALAATQTVTSFSWRDYYEEELFNLIQSGREWYGYQFKNVPFKYSFIVNNFVQNAELKIKVRTVSRAEYGEKVIYSLNESQLGYADFSSVDFSSTENTYGVIRENQFTVGLNSESNSFTAQTTVAGVNDEDYIDYVTLNARCGLTVTDFPFFFRDINSYLNGGIAQFKLGNANTNTQVWNVTSQKSVYSLTGNLNGDIFEFKSPVDSLYEFVAIDLARNYPSPVLTDEILNDLGWIGNQNLHAISTPEMLIVTHPLFLEAADTLAELHRTEDNMTVTVVTTEQVYNEFSSGKADVCAIRNFARMLWERSTGSSKFKYLLLFGDGSYDNRTYNENNTNYIPTYQDKESLRPTVSFTTDDIFGQLEPGEWSNSGTLEIGVGRLPVYWTKENGDKIAWDMIKKIKIYYQPEVDRDWRNRMIFLGDDGDSYWDSTIFLRDTERLINTIRSEAPSINFSKIYLDAYTQVNSSTGPSYPEVEKALQEAFNKGALVFNYMGHGGEQGITQEKVMQKSDFERLSNSPYFPLFITATCQVSRFDEVKIEENLYTRVVTAGEAALLNPKGGAIAMFTTTRVVYQTSNYELSQSVYQNMFKKDEQGKRYRLGDLIRIAKNQNQSMNDKKFALLGDPAITISYGEYKVVTDSINKSPLTGVSDTVNALGKVKIAGHLEYNDSTPIEHFNGVVQVSVFDKEYEVETKGNDINMPIFKFTMQDKLLFRGNASVNEGRFSIEFIVPKDISYNYGKGRVTYYAYNPEINATGYCENFVIGGTSENIDMDSEGPEIKLFLNDENFVDGGITSPSPVLLANLFDEHGINTTSIGIGHDISAFLDSHYSDVIILNDYFDGALNDYRSGTIRYLLQDLGEGHHTINVKVWDTYNNSSDANLGFYVARGDKIIINKLFNYPNPMTTSTTFQYSHNMPGVHHVILEIYDLSGKKIYDYRKTNQESGFVSEPILWDRMTSSLTQIQPGIYIYRIIVNVVSDNDGENYESSLTNKLIIIP
jgi:hypothetical protein